MHRIKDRDIRTTRNRLTRREYAEAFDAGILQPRNTLGARRGANMNDCDREELRLSVECTEHGILLDDPQWDIACDAVTGREKV